MILRWSTVIELVRALAIKTALLLDIEVLFPYLPSFLLLVVHADHLAVQLAPTVLDVEDLAALQPLLVTVDYVHDEEADRQPDDQDNDHCRLHADVVDDRQALLLINFFVI